MDIVSVEQKWNKFWEDNGINDFDKNRTGKKYYVLEMFSYPSGSNLHVGHWYNYAPSDTFARFKRMQGYNVFQPVGFDAFGLPAENYAIKTGVHPEDSTLKNIKTMEKQLRSLGAMFDWNSELYTCSPDYYKWTQWQFLKFYEHNMAYKATASVNWCNTCKTVLSNEDAAGGVCERCGNTVVQKEKNQWMLKMSEYAQSLLDGLEETAFADRVKLGQINWIGKSTGVEVEIELTTGGKFSIFTTCIETIYGVTFFVIAPDGKLIKELMPKIKNKEEVQNYILETSKKSNMDRTSLNKTKTGCVLKGIEAINPVNGKKVPIFVGDFVLGSYGTGAVMAVPAHDARDYEYAKVHNLEMIEVISGGNIKEKAYEKEEYLPINPKLLNSEEFTGLTVSEAKEKITEKLVNMGKAKVVNNYKMRDWIFSRQRFWGEPIPMINCPKCGWVPVPENELPVLLPDVANYEPTDDGESPLAKITDWVNCKCPKCGADAKRETDTMPNWAGSSWYFLRFMDAHNNKEFASMDAMKYWGKVDWYNGGMEHTARHLLYARFWVQFLYNIGLVPNKEMIYKRVSHGMVLGSNNEKMSKSKGNVINPDDIVNEFGADTLRLYEMFMGDYTQDAPWSTDSLRGCKRFIDKVIRLKDKIGDGDGYSKKLEPLIHKTIKKVQTDLTTMAYNTAVSALMILANSFDAEDKITKEDYHLLLTLLNPIAPHITEELNEQLGFKPICESSWPKYDEAKTIDSEKEIPVQINGKVRGKIAVDSNLTNEEMALIAKTIPNVKSNLDGKEIVKVITVPKKLVNIVVK